MKPGSELAAWLADPKRQAEALAAMNAFGEQSAARPLLAELKRDLNALETPDFPSVFAIVERLFARHDEVDALFHDLLVASAADPFFSPPLPRIQTEFASGLLLFENPLVLLALTAVNVEALAAKKLNPREKSSINFMGVPTLFRFIRSGGATLSMWEAPEIRPGFSMETSGRCRMTGLVEIKDGDTLLIDGRRESFVIEHARSDMVYLNAAVRAGEAPLAVEYDSRSLTFVGAATTDEASSRIQMMVSLLRELDREDAAPLFADLLESPHFYTRWHVMREFLALDAEAALPHLRAMAAHDVHPEVRAVARQTLDAFFPDDLKEAC